jgi:LysM repeat protein/ABC-type branched-subunit amino acid transport system substrate-binding protein
MVLRIPKKSVAITPESESQKEVAKSAAVKKEQPKTQDNPDYFIYQVKKQETLYGIAKQNNLTVDDILNANPGLETLQDGMEIKIPKKKSSDKPVISVPATETVTNPATMPTEITVKSGETLYSISKTYGTTVDDLIDLNPQVSSGLKAGMVLKLRKPAALNEIKTAPSSTIIPVTASGCYSPDNIKKTYQVALLLPFALDDIPVAPEPAEQKEPSDIQSYNYLQFYAGFMLAADSLEKYGLHARIQVLDADKLDDTLKIKQTLRKPGLDKMDLFVGPMYAPSFSIAARFARKNSIGIINPLSRRESIVDGNPFVIKAQVSGAGIAAKLYTYISKHHPNANVIAVTNDKKEFKSLFDAFKAGMKASLADHTFKGTFQEANYSTDYITGVAKKLKPGVKNIVILFSNNKTAVPNFVSSLNPHSKSNDIFLFGMDGWEELGLETEFLINLNFHQVTSGYIDYESETVQQFTSRFRTKYGAVPLESKYAFLGYDIGWYFLTSLMWYGDNYLTCLSENQSKGLQYNFRFAAADKGDGFQNQDVTIVKLLDYKMVKVE